MTGTNSSGDTGHPFIDYPLVYVFKVMGLAGADFEAHARGLVTRAAGTEEDLSVSVRESARGKYQSVSVALRLRSETQRRAVYEALHGDARVVYYL